MRTEARNWWKQAEDDFEKAKILFDNKKYDGTTFFCQQAVEKGLKALIIKEQKKIKKIHDLVRLGKDVELPAPFSQYVKELTQAYIYSRYPDTERVKNIKDVASDFLKYSEEILKWIEKRM
jgi:HEPN domain-containing protein